MDANEAVRWPLAHYPHLQEGGVSRKLLMRWLKRGEGCDCSLKEAETVEQK